MNKITIVFFLSYFSFCSNIRSRHTFPLGIQTIIVQPIGKVDTNLLDSLKTRLEEFGNMRVLIEKEKLLPSHAYNPYRHRYKADSLLVFLNTQNIAFNTKILGITESDIEILLNKTNTWGVMGLSFLPGNRCVISTYRPKKTSLGKMHLLDRMFSLCMHELGHSYSLDHCDQLYCIMQDAKGGNRLDYSGSFCKLCKQKLQVKGLLNSD